MTPVELIAAVFFGLWLALTVVHQFEPAALRRVDFQGFVPSCRFFAPNPMVTDTRIYYACSQLSAGSVNELVWRPLLCAERDRWSFLWNPSLRLSKTANILARQLHKLEAQPHFEFTRPYLRLLTLASAMAGEGRADDGYVRFILTRHRGIQSPVKHVSFVSSAHRATTE